MAADGLDELDYGILHLLQEDARDQTPVDMADDLPVSDTTIRNRIEALEEQGIIEGYVPLINYEKAGFPIRIQFSCTVPPKQREEIAEKALQVSHVVSVDEMLTAKENIQVLAVTNTSEEINEITSELDELPLTIERETLLRQSLLRPFNHFDEDIASSE